MKNIKDYKGNGARDLPACGAVSNRATAYSPKYDGDRHNWPDLAAIKRTWG